MNEMRKLKVLVVDDEKAIRNFFIHLLRLEGVEAKTAEDGVAAIKAAKKETFDLVFLDIRMPRLNGVETFSQLKKITPSINCVFITGYAVEASFIEQLKQPQTFFLKKPFDDIGEIRAMVNKVLQDAKARAEVIYSQKAVFQERRAYLRVDAVLKVDYRIKNSRQDFKRSVGRNVSPCGMSLCSEEDLAEGMMLELRIGCVEYGRVCEAEAKVVWSRSVKDKSGCCNVGIEFTKIDMPEFSELLMCCISR